MEFQVACDCGNVLWVSEGMAGSSTTCSCGRTVAVPSLSALRAQPLPDAATPPASDPGSPTEPPPGPNRLADITAPVQVFLRTEGGDQPNRRASVMAALTPDAIWLQDTWQLRRVPLQHLQIEKRRKGKQWVMTLGPEPAAEKLTLTFPSAQEGKHWYRDVQVRQPQLPPDAPRDDRYQPEGVAMVRRAPEVPHQVLGQVEFTGQTQWAADRALQLRAAIRGADAVIDVHRHKCPDVGWGARHVSGLAVRVADADARKRLRLRWYAEELSALVRRLLVLLILQAAVLFLTVTFFSGRSSLQPPSGETPSEAVASAGLGIGMLFAWPLLLVILLRVLRWPQLLCGVGFAALAITTGRGLTVWLAHLLAVQTTGAPLAESKFWILVDPIDWAFVIAGVVLWVRAWRLARAARQILPREMQTAPGARRTCARGLVAVTGVYALALIGFAGISRYHASAHLLQQGDLHRTWFSGPGFDSRREQEAILALNTGVTQGKAGDRDAEEQSYQRALQLWEGLAAGRSAPAVYRANLAITLNNLGSVRVEQGRLDEAERCYARAVALADDLARDSYPMDDQFKQTMAGARKALAALHKGKSLRLLDDKARTAGRKYEEAQVKAQQGDVEAERLYREAIALWEEVLPHATSATYRKRAVAQLATTYLQLGELQQQLNKRSTAEATLKKGIEYGEKAVALDPDRPLLRHNLELARQMLEELRDQALQDEITKLGAAERFADIIDLYARTIEEQEERVRSAKDHGTAVRRLAYRLDRFAWFLAHCPDRRVRDAKAAVKHARRATQLQPDAGEYWYTLAMVQYRHGDWQDSLTSLEELKARAHGLDAPGWLLSAMDLHQLKRRDEARAALRKAGEWMDEQKRQAEGNALLRFRYETIRPAIEALQREAEDLIEGRDPANRGVG